MSQLFEVAILQTVTKKQSEDGESAKLVFGPKAVVAADAQSAAISAVMDNPEAMKGVDRSRMQVLVRPFA